VESEGLYFKKGFMDERYEVRNIKDSIRLDGLVLEIELPFVDE